MQLGTIPADSSRIPSLLVVDSVAGIQITVSICQTRRVQNPAMLNAKTSARPWADTVIRVLTRAADGTVRLTLLEAVFAIAARVRSFPMGGDGDDKVLLFQI